MEVLEAFGPRIVKYNLTESETQSLYNMCKPNSDEANANLISFISEEYKIARQLRELDVYQTIHQNMESYLTVDCGHYNNALLHGIDTLELTSAWYNNQVAMEYNPPHIHYPGADVVCVIFPKIILDDDAKQFVVLEQGGLTGSRKALGQLHFRHGEPSPNGFGRTQITVQPEEGEMYIFPSSLLHYTSPILGNSIRYSISCNFKFTKLAIKAQFQI